MLSRRKIFVLPAAAALFALAGPVTAAEYPVKPIRLIIPFGPGTGSDVLGRVVAQRLSVELGQSVVVENRPGATGGVGTREVQNATPDGYSLIWGTNATLITTPTLNPEMTYRADKDLAPIAMVARTPMVLVTGTTASSPKTVPELTAKLKSKRNTFGSTGVGTNGHVISEIMLKEMGTSATLVTYKGSSESLTDVLRGETAFAVDTPAAILPFVKSGKLVPLAVTGTDRIPILPDMPTFREVGINGLTTVYAWFGVLGPKNMPAEVAKLLSDKLSITMKNEDVLARMKTMEIDAFVMPTEEFKKFIGKEIDEWGGFIKSTGIKVGK